MYKIHKSELANIVGDDAKVVLESFEIFDEVLEYTSTLGGSSIVYGGAIRDSLLGARFDDIDIKTTNTEDEILKLFPKFKKRVRSNNESIVYFGRYKNVFIEITRFEDVEVSTLEDVRKHHKTRDLTINNLFYDGEFIYDRETGVNDLFEKKLRFGNESDFANNVSERPMVLLKNLRLIAKLGLRPNKDLLNFLVKNKDSLDKITESIFINEGYKTIKYKYVHLLIATLMDVGFINDCFNHDNNKRRILPPEELVEKNFNLSSCYWSIILGSNAMTQLMKFYKIPNERIENTIRVVKKYKKKIEENEERRSIKSTEDLKIFILEKLVQDTSFR